jgi:hypothetical protein
MPSHFPQHKNFYGEEKSRRRGIFLNLFMQIYSFAPPGKSGIMFSSLP